MHFLAPAIQALGGRLVRSFAFLVPWHGTADQLQERLAGAFKSPIIIAELTGDWALY